jgi:hypothetical protein
MPATRFGDTTPYFNIAKEFGVSYDDVLALADFATHLRIGRNLADAVRRHPAQIGVERCRELDRAVCDQVLRFREIQEGAPY